MVPKKYKEEKDTSAIKIKKTYFNRKKIKEIITIFLVIKKLKKIEKIVANNTTNTNIKPTITAYKYCLMKFLENSIWYESENPEKIEFTPLPIKIIDKKRVVESNPVLFLLLISIKISWKKFEDSFGINDSIKSKKIWSKFSIGKKGIKFNTNNKKGKKAMKKLKEILPALAVIDPFKSPVRYNLNNSYKEKP